MQGEVFPDEGLFCLSLETFFVLYDTGGNNGINSIKGCDNSKHFYKMNSGNSRQQK
jgi:peptidyl-tRNA hydrolase